MTAHTYHESSLTAGLADGCPRCEEHADDPLSALDIEHVRDLWERMLGYEFASDRSSAAAEAAFNGYRSEAESRACHRLYRMAQLLQGIGIDPRDVTPGEPATFVQRSPAAAWDTRVCPGCACRVVLPANASGIRCPVCEALL